MSSQDDMSAVSFLGISGASEFQNGNDRRRGSQYASPLPRADLGGIDTTIVDRRGGTHGTLPQLRPVHVSCANEEDEVIVAVGTVLARRVTMIVPLKRQPRRAEDERDHSSTTPPPALTGAGMEKAAGH